MQQFYTSSSNLPYTPPYTPPHNHAHLDHSYFNLAHSRNAQLGAIEPMFSGFARTPSTPSHNQVQGFGNYTNEVSLSYNLPFCDSMPHPSASLARGAGTIRSVRSRRQERAAMRSPYTPPRKHSTLDKSSGSSGRRHGADTSPSRARIASPEQLAMQSVFSLSDKPIKSRSPRKQKPVAQPEWVAERQQQTQTAVARSSGCFYAPLPRPKLVPQAKIQEAEAVTLKEALATVDELMATFYNMSSEEQSQWLEEEFTLMMSLAF